MKAAREEATGGTARSLRTRSSCFLCMAQGTGGQSRVEVHCVDYGSSPIQPKGPIHTMMELNVSLDFACCHCNQSVGVTLKCEGKGLAAGPCTVASVKVPCPSCNAVNLLYFEPSGTVHGVRPYKAPYRLPEPSLN